MPLYSYTAREKDGRIKQGVKEAESQEEALSSLQSSGFLVTQLTEVIEPKVFQKRKRRVKHRIHHRIKRDDLVLMARQLATLVGAGVTLLRSFEIIIQQIPSLKLKRVLESIQADIRAGKTFHSAIAKHPKVFSDFWVNLIRMGEAGGHLSQTLEQLADYLESAGELRRKAISAMIYPLILLAVSGLVVAAFLLKIVPIFTELFDSFEIELPRLTVFVISASVALRNYFLFILGGGIGSFFLMRFALSTERGRLMWDRTVLSLPLMGELIRKMAIANFAKGLGTLIKSGVPILYSLEIIGKSAGNKVVAQILEDVRLEVREGKPIAAPLAMGEVFDPVVVQMVKIGEEIGELGNMLEKVGNFYQAQVETQTDRLISLIEPIAILVMGVIVGTLVVSMYLPIFSISQLAGR